MPAARPAQLLGVLFSFLSYIILYLKYKIMWATSYNNNQRGSITIIATE
jgi:hypothetical protein